VTPSLETERLHLRHFRESDHEPLAEYHADAELTRYLGDALSPAENWRWAAFDAWALEPAGFRLLGA
jgi:RimJ/RimL family protein N-acetyltransferase